jgi:hypothetical protein
MIALATHRSGSPARGDAPSAVATRVGRPCGSRRGAPRRVRHVVWIVMENKSLAQVVGAPAAPYITRLARACGLAARFFAEAHPSLPNYVAMTSGSTQRIADDDDPAAHRLAVPSVFSLLRGSWTALQESMPSPCRRSDAGLYAVRHDPAAYYTSIRSSCARRDLPLRRRLDLRARFTFITPNLCDDMHACPGALDERAQVANGDRWLGRWLPRILGSREYRSGGTVVFVTWDEDDGASRQHVPTLVVSPYTRPRTRSLRRFDHYSLLRTSEQLLGLRPLLGRAAHAASMRHAFHL